MMVLAYVPIAALLTVLTIQMQAQTAAPQAMEPPSGDTMTISGRVTDRETGQPLPRARVGLYIGIAYLKTPPLRSTVTDARGYYELPNLPAGKYTVAAQPPPGVATHLAQVYGHDAPFDQMSATYIAPQVLTGQDLRDVDIALSRASTIEGRVLNGDGDPLAGIAVSLNRSERLAGDPIVRFTDDRGVFRHFGLAPGQYRVCASVPTRAGSAETLRRACYRDGLEPIELGAGGVSGIDMRLTSGRAATVSGIVLDASGTPLEQNHLQITEENGIDRRPLPIEVLPGGRFVARNVERGTYRVMAARGASPLEQVAAELVILSVRVDGDIDNLVVRTRAGAGVSGVVIFEDGPPPPGPGKMMVYARHDISTSAAILGMPVTATGIFQRTGVVQPDSSFRLEGILGPALIAVSGQPSGWRVRSITFGGRDIFDVPVEFEGTGDPQPVTIVLTKRVATIAGRVTPPTTRKRALLLITSDRSRWTSRSAVASVTSVKDDGTFAFTPVLAGDYYVVATTQMTWMVEEPQRLAAAIERLTAQSVMVSLADGERRQLTLYVSDDR